jgi:predicted GIY-YIG superfamily endonuclease
MARGRMLSKTLSTSECSVKRRSRWRTAESARALPRHGGVYALYSFGRLVYIGRSGNLRSRVTEHVKKKSTDAIKFRYLPSLKSQRRLESRLIARVRPVLNKAVYVQSSWTRHRYGW